MENLEHMEEPTPCIHCGEWFDLQDGYESEKWHPNTTICDNCRAQEIEEISKDEEIEDLTENLSDAEDNVVRYRKRLRELGVILKDSKSEKWDKLDEEISKIYEEQTDSVAQDLTDVGLAAAEAFEYL
jgi:hypothetical protein